RPFSSVHLIQPELVDHNYSKDHNVFKPLNFSWSWSGSILGRPIYETKQSGGHSLPNGNFIFCETSLGQVSEISPQGELVWTYRNPVGKTVVTQYDDVPQYSNAIFRAEKYPVDYVGFKGKDLTPKG